MSDGTINLESVKQSNINWFIEKMNDCIPSFSLRSAKSLKVSIILWKSFSSISKEKLKKETNTMDWTYQIYLEEMGLQKTASLYSVMDLKKFF